MPFRALYPDRVRKHDLRRILQGCARFLQCYGFWPTLRDISDFLSADHGAVIDCTNHLLDVGLLGQHKHRGHRTVYITAQGWQVLGWEPLEPWTRRPRTPHHWLANEAALQLRRELQKDGVV